MRVHNASSPSTGYLVRSKQMLDELGPRVCASEISYGVADGVGSCR